MRCKACDAGLNDREATRKTLITGEYPDLCDNCLGTITEDCPTTDSPYSDVKVEEGEEDENENN